MILASDKNTLKMSKITEYERLDIFHVKDMQLDLPAYLPKNLTSYENAP